MSYATYSNEELRRVLVADPKDAAAIVEAVDRFARGATDDEIESARDIAWQDGYDEGYSEGYYEGCCD